MAYREEQITGKRLVRFRREALQAIDSRIEELTKLKNVVLNNAVYKKISKQDEYYYIKGESDFLKNPNEWYQGLQWTAYGYFLDTDEFIYNGKAVGGVMVSLKAPSNIPESRIQKSAYVSYSKTTGYSVSIRCNAKNIIVLPYKVYFLVENNDPVPILDPVEVDEETLCKYSCHYVEGLNVGASSSWLI